MIVHYRRRKYWAIAKQFIDAGLPRRCVAIYRLHRYMTPLAIKVMINEIKRIRKEKKWTGLTPGSQKSA